MNKIDPRFKQVPGLPDYFCTKEGEVLSLVRPDNPLKLKHYKTKAGSLVVGMRGGMTKTVAELVMTTWGPKKPSPNHQVKIMDGNKQNIHLDNLQWEDRMEIRSMAGSMEEKSIKMKAAHAAGKFVDAPRKAKETKLRNKLIRMAEEGMTDYDD